MKKHNKLERLRQQQLLSTRASIRKPHLLPQDARRKGLKLPYPCLHCLPALRDARITVFKSFSLIMMQCHSASLTPKNPERGLKFVCGLILHLCKQAFLLFLNILSLFLNNIDSFPLWTYRMVFLKFVEIELCFEK